MSAKGVTMIFYVRIVRTFFLLAPFVLLLSCGGPDTSLDQRPIVVALDEHEKHTLDPSLERNSLVLRVAVSAMISPKATLSYYEELIQHISSQLNRESKIVQRKTYEEVNTMLANGDVDFAFVCSGAFVEGEQSIGLEILAAPVVNGSPHYQAYIIVNKQSPVTRFEELRGKSFAFTDPLSNTGYAYAIRRVRQLNSNFDGFFSWTLFSYAHDYSIQLVERGQVEGATIDGLILDYLQQKNPKTVENVRIIEKSEKYGIPPVVALKNSDPKIRADVRGVLLRLHDDPEGLRILRNLNIEKFVLVSSDLYQSVRDNRKAVNK